MIYMMVKNNLPKTNMNKNHSAIEHPLLVVETSAPTHVPTYRKIILHGFFSVNNLLLGPNYSLQLSVIALISYSYKLAIQNP